MNPLRFYTDYVEHPRWGHTPQFTGVEPIAKPLGYRLTTYISHGLIPGTAIAADLEGQFHSPVPVLYYFDLARICADCQRPFIFYAEEQKFWYESLGFTLNSDCVRCVPCRKRLQGIAQTRERYEELSHIPSRSTAENLEMADCCLTLIEASIFPHRQTQHVRALLNRVRAENDPVAQARSNGLRARLAAVEAGTGP
jgi:hypothetical protein